MANFRCSLPGFSPSAVCGWLLLALCGCGSKTDLLIGTDQGAICATSQAPPAASLVHRYSFEGTGTTITDSVGGASGQTAALAPGTPPQLDGSGHLALDGVTGYVDLPNGIVSSLPDATFIAWTAWLGGPAYERIFDFGSSTAGEGLRGGCESCVLLMTSSGTAQETGLCAQAHAPTLDEAQIPTTALLDKTFRQVALVFKSGQSMALYLDGVPIGTTPTAIALSDIVDNNNWLGLSQYSLDHTYLGEYEEFRIYNRALSPCEIAATVENGAQVP
jgi:hypothetical protein